VRVRSLLPGMLGVMGSLLIAAAAEAGTLQTWRFNPSDNRLVFTTDDDVQPRAQLIGDPTRLVLDLPGVLLGRSLTRQSYSGAIREVRVGQLDSQTTRIVIELSPGYTLDPSRVLVRGNSPTEWSVQIPAPQYAAVSGDDSQPSRPSRPDRPISRGTTQLEEFQVTGDGFFIRTSGSNPEVEINRSRDRRRVTLELPNTVPSADLDTDFAVNRFGVSRVQIAQSDNTPPTTRITLNLNRDASDWQAIASNLGGVVLLPKGGTSIAPIGRGETPQPARPRQGRLATVQSVELTGGGTQLMVRADREISFQSGWDRSTGLYTITIPNAQLADRVTGPQLRANSGLRRVRLLQEDSQTVTVLVEPAQGVPLGSAFKPNDQAVALSFGRPVAQYPPTDLPETPDEPPQYIPRPRPTQPPTNNLLPPTNPLPPGNLPTVPRGRTIVVIDPGHGGSDPGAVGIGGLREAPTVLSIGTQVAQLLQQQGVQAVITRQGDRDVELEPRVQIAQQSNATLFVSIHANSIDMSRPEVNGLETYYYSDSGARLGRVIHNAVVQGTGMRDRGLRQARFYVIRNTSMPAVLVEVGFVTGSEDAARLSSPEGRNQLAQSIARGILQYIQQNL
jgi:N-acetylmuramoyl-L-alanine amidase